MEFIENITLAEDLIDNENNQDIQPVKVVSTRMLNKKLTSKRRKDMVIISVLGSPAIFLLRKINKLNWLYVIGYSFIAGFGLMYCLLNVGSSVMYFTSTFNVFFCVLVGLVATVTGAIFYKTLLLFEKNNHKKIT